MSHAGLVPAIRLAENVGLEDPVRERVHLSAKVGAAGMVAVDVKWRTGSEGRISTLKRGFGWDRTRIDTTEAARIWVGHGILAHNLAKISALAA